MDEITEKQDTSKLLPEDAFMMRYGLTMSEMHEKFFDIAYTAVLKEVLPARPWTKRDPKNNLAADNATHDWAHRTARIANIFAFHVVEFRKLQAGILPPLNVQEPEAPDGDQASEPSNEEQGETANAQ